MGRADYLREGDWNAICFHCGRKFKASEMRRYWKGYYVCPEHWEIRQPQDFVRGIPDSQVPGWVQPPVNSFIGVCTPTGLSGIATLAVAGCATPSTVPPASYGVGPAPPSPPPVNAFSAAYPPSGTGIWTTLYGTMAIFPGPPAPPAGSLAITNTNGSDSAHSYITALPALIKDSTQQASTPFNPNSSIAALGVFWRAQTLQAVPSILFNGYRGDFALGNLRIIRFDAGAATVIASVACTNLTYYGQIGNSYTFNVTVTGSTFSFFLSASGQPNSNTVSVTGAPTASYPAGRIGILSFWNNGGVGGTNYWSNYAATWTT